MVFEENQEELLKNNEINLDNLKEIKNSEIYDFCTAIEWYAQIMNEKDEHEQARMIHDLLFKAFNKNDDVTLNREMLKMWKKLYHALCYKLDGMAMIEESNEVIIQMTEDWKQIMKAKA